MPRTIDEGFRDFHAKLTATASETEATKKHRASIEACLRNNFRMTSFFRSGSFGNGTNVSGFSDVDYFAVIPVDRLKESSNYSLQLIKNALDTRFPFTNVCVRCPAVKVPFGQYVSQDTEIVPADYIKTERGVRICDIPDCVNGWMRASPEAHNAYVAYVNKEKNYKVKPLIRFMKAWKYFRNVPISSFYLELRTTKYAAFEKAIVYSIDIRNMLKFLFEQNIPAIQDPMGISGYIYPCQSETQKEDALSKIETAYTRAHKAREAESSNDIKGAFEWWELLFGKSFPSYYY